MVVFFVSAILAVFFFGASKMKYVSENTRQWVKAVLFSAMLGGIQTALAAGGLSTGESTVKQWFQEWYNILAIVAGVAIAMVAVGGYFQEKTFGDILRVCGWIFLFGCGPALAAGLIKLAKSVTF
jgi:hypothetical protein